MPLPKPSLPTYELELPSNGKKIKYRPFVVREEKILFHYKNYRMIIRIIREKIRINK